MDNLQEVYEELKQENEKLRYHLKLILMMLPKSTGHEFFQYAIDFNLSEKDTAKILTTLAMIDDKLKNEAIDDILADLYAHDFDLSVPVEYLGQQFANYIQELFGSHINPVYLLNSCQRQGIYPETCELLLAQIKNQK